MGAKTPEQLNVRRSAVKCDVCGRKFLNIQALKSHHKFLHEKPDNAIAKRVPIKKQVEMRPLRKKLVPVSMLKRVIPATPSKQGNETEVKDKTLESAGKEPVVFGEMKKKRPEFECPLCDQKFIVYFSAFRHIQKSHCVDDKGQKVAPNSPNLVKPIRIEECASCNKVIRSTQPHYCPKQHANKDMFLCMGCDQIFSGLVLFQHHLKGLHADGAQNYFFPSREEFTCWKLDLEKQVKYDFVCLNKQKSTEIYHCSAYQSALVTSTIQLCPAAITVREYSKGIHVCYYKEHNGHEYEDSPLKKYEQYEINLYLRDTEELKMEAEDDNDLYLQFKRMLTCIVSDAAKVDILMLKNLLGKALEMTALLKNNSGEERNMPLVSKSLTDSQISRTLDNSKSAKPMKRKLSPLPKEPKKVEPKKVEIKKVEPKKVEPKKVKKDPPPIEKLVENVNKKVTRNSPAVVKSVSFKKTLSKKNDEIQEEKEQEKNGQEKTPPATPVQRSLLQSPSSFNDSYKHFVDQNFKCITDTSTSTPKPKTIVKKKEVVKTKIGQFKVKPSSPSPKSSSPNDSLVKESSPKVSSPKATSPKVMESKELAITPKALKAILDIQYEVKEQENDCNILILKI